MATDRQIHETIARCVSIMACYQNSERTSQSAELMVAEVQTVAGWVLELNLGMEEVDDRILRPVADDLIKRFGHEVGPRLDAAFSEAFEGLLATHEKVYGAQFSIH